MADQPLNQPAEIPPELDRWNWGAFFLNWIWGIGNSVFIALLMFLPFVNIVMIFVLGARGSRWAWRNRAWRDAEHFRSTQRKWAIAGAIVWIFFIGLFGAIFVSIPSIMKSSDAYKMTMETIRADDRVKAAIGDTFSDNYWISGSVNVEGDGTGDAKLSIPIHGDKGSGTAMSHAVRRTGQWDMRLIVVRVDGTEAPIILMNKDNVDVPGGTLSL